MGNLLCEYESIIDQDKTILISNEETNVAVPVGKAGRGKKSVAVPTCHKFLPWQRFEAVFSICVIDISVPYNIHQYTDPGVPCLSSSLSLAIPTWVLSARLAGWLADSQILSPVAVKLEVKLSDFCGHYGNPNKTWKTKSHLSTVHIKNGKGEKNK